MAAGEGVAGLQRLDGDRPGLGPDAAVTDIVRRRRGAVFRSGNRSGAGTGGERRDVPRRRVRHRRRCVLKRRSIIPAVLLLRLRNQAFQESPVRHSPSSFHG